MLLQFCSPGLYEHNVFSQKSSFTLTIPLLQSCVVRLNQTREQLSIYHHLRSSNHYTLQSLLCPHQPNPTPYKHHTHTQTHRSTLRGHTWGVKYYQAEDHKTQGGTTSAERSWEASQTSTGDVSKPSESSSRFRAS